MYAVFKNNYSDVFYKHVEPFYSLQRIDKNGLTSSEGWIIIGPITNQRDAPLIVFPKIRVALTNSKQEIKHNFEKRKELFTFQ